MQLLYREEAAILCLSTEIRDETRSRRLTVSVVHLLRFLGRCQHGHATSQPSPGCLAWRRGGVNHRRRHLEHADGARASVSQEQVQAERVTCYRPCGHAGERFLVRLFRVLWYPSPHDREHCSQRNGGDHDGTGTAPEEVRRGEGVDWGPDGSSSTYATGQCSHMHDVVRHRAGGAHEGGSDRECGEVRRFGAGVSG
ncbi:unnamed protein product [Ectocarpus fasciculatus]